MGSIYFGSAKKLSMFKLIQIVFISLVLAFLTANLSAQNTAYISGYIKGMGTGKKLLLGNRPTGTGPGFIFDSYDSTYSKNDSFYFNPIKFQHVSDYSVEVEDLKGWISFLIDTGHISVTGNSDTVYWSRVRGSGNQDLIRKFYREWYLPWDKEYTMVRNKLQIRKEKDSNLYNKSLDTLQNMVTMFRQNVINFYRKNVEKKPYAAFIALRMSSLQVMTDSMLQIYFNLLPFEVQNSPALEDVAYRLNGFKENISKGKKLPSFKFSTPKNKTINLKNVKAKYKLLVFWASWCAPCLREIPLLDSLNKKFEFKGLKILCINVDNTKEIWKNNISKYAFKCVHLYQGSYSTSAFYKYFNIESIPFLVLLDNKDRIIKYDAKINEIQSFLE